jgi:hypothetical protein
MNLKDARRELNGTGVSIKYIEDTGEYRVNLRADKEATAYYASDIDDALNTGRAMYAHYLKYGK